MKVLLITGVLAQEIVEGYAKESKIETRVYENMIKTYSTRLSEIEEQIAYLDARDAIRSEGKIKKEGKK